MKGRMEWCFACESRAWVPADSGKCVECLAAAAPKRNWTPEEDFVVRDLYGRELPAGLQRELFKRTGSARSRVAIVVRAQKLDLDHRETQGAFTIQEAAKMLGVKPWIIHQAIAAGTVKPTGRGKIHLLEHDQVDKLAELYPPPPARHIAPLDAGRRLGYSETHIFRLLKAGAIRSVKRGSRWYVDLDHVEQLEAEFRATGEVKRDWGDLPGLEAERQKASEWARTRRKQARQEARKTVWYTQSAAAKVLGVGCHAMGRMLERGEVRGKRENYLWLAERAHVDEIAGMRAGGKDGAA